MLPLCNLLKCPFSKDSSKKVIGGLYNEKRKLLWKIRNMCLDLILMEKICQMLQIYYFIPFSLNLQLIFKVNKNILY